MVKLLLAYQEPSEQINFFLKSVSESLDKHFKSNDFSTLFLSVQKSSHSERSGFDPLFISYSDLNLSYSNFELLSLKERIIFFACISGWYSKFSFTPSDNNLLSRTLSLSTDHVGALNDFFNPENLENNYGSCELFLLEPTAEKEYELEGEWIKSNKPKDLGSKEYFLFEALNHTLKTLYIDELKAFLITCSNSSVLISKNDEISICGWEILQPGEKIIINQEASIDYHDLKNRFLRKKYADELQYEVNDLSYSYSNGKGLKRINLNIDPGTLAGVLGKEGTGKSTLLKLLAGDIQSHSGDIIINGYSLKKELYHLKGMIGFVSEDDLLYDELTVFENLYLSARLYLGKMSEFNIRQKVNDLLKYLELDELKKIKVGTITDKHLQPGQRRLLNIALELIRDPQILIVDNAIAPLSISDSTKIIEVLSDFTFKGRIVVTSITQTSTKAFSSFNKLFILDEGGFPVYYDKSDYVWDYFTRVMDIYHDTSTQEHGPDSILNLIGLTKHSEEKSSRERIISPVRLYKHYLEKTTKTKALAHNRRILPDKILHPPTLDRQYIIYYIRNFKTKSARSRELIFTLLISPISAFILAFILKSTTGKDYSFAENQNIPVYFFLSIIFAIFLGLVQSANEIFKEININRKQEYLNLSWFSYINSKITYLFIIGLLQSVLFIAISHLILEIKGLFLVHWFIYFSCHAFGLILGLLYSSLHKTLEGIYIRSIPVIIILQLIYGGGFINLQSLSNNNNAYTPIVSDLMVTRWAYESLMVYQFKNNSYEKSIYDYERSMSSAIFHTSYLIQSLKSQLKYCSFNYETKPYTCDKFLRILQSEMTKLNELYNIFPYENHSLLTIDEFNPEIAADALEYLEYLEISIYSVYETSSEQKKEHIEHLKDSIGNYSFDKLKMQNFNYAVDDAVKRYHIDNGVKYKSGIPIQLSDAIYQYPVSDFGRGIMFLPEKKLNAQSIDTTEFNSSIIWIINLFLYVFLITGILSYHKSKN
ncbi:MAG: ATP-binding cassette domain-containing protein [Bacteroidales bacterium]|nr:ATP-binding cassette domain-containing protein [Bacteroidales bacterium]